MFNGIEESHAVAPAAEGMSACRGPNNQSYVCEAGHCCDGGPCCRYYYELWYFWLVVALVLLLLGVCVCQHQRAKRRFRQRRRQQQINEIAFREAHSGTRLPLYLRFLPDYLLPAYEEVEERLTTPPPPYSPPLSPQAMPLHLQATPLLPAEEHRAPVFPAAEAPPPSLLLPPPVRQCGQACCPGNKDQTPGRYRRFTGDSGIDVWEHQSILGRGEEGEGEGEGECEPQPSSGDDGNSTQLSVNKDGL